MNPLVNDFPEGFIHSKPLCEERALRRSNGVPYGRYPEKQTPPF